MSQHSQNPPGSVEIGGATFAVVDPGQAQILIASLRDFDGRPIYDLIAEAGRVAPTAGAPVLLHAPDDVAMDTLLLDCRVDAHPELFVLGFIFGKNLQVETWVQASATDRSPALMVLGSLTTLNLCLHGNVHTIGGELKCDTLWGQSSDGRLHVLGGTTAWLIHSDDMPMHFSAFSGVEAVIGQGPGPFRITIQAQLQNDEGQHLSEQLVFPSTHRLSDIADDEVLSVEDDLHGERFSDAALTAIAQGRSLLDQDKEGRHQYLDFTAQIYDIFSKLEAAYQRQGACALTALHEGASYAYDHVEVQQVHWRQLRQTLNNPAVTMTASQALHGRTVKLELGYLDAEGDVRLCWDGYLSSGGLNSKPSSAPCCKHIACSHACCRRRRLGRFGSSG